MKLNHECIRDFLLVCEDIPYDENPDMKYFLESKKLSNYSPEDILYTAEQLSNADFIIIKRIKAWGIPFDGLFINITWNGHQFLDSIRSDTVWNKTKKRISSTVGSASLNVFSAVATSIAKNMLNL